MKKLLAAMFLALLMVGWGEDAQQKEATAAPRYSPPPPPEIVVIVAEDFVGTYEVVETDWGPAKLVFLENGVGEYHNTDPLGHTTVILIKWEIVDEGFVKWECEISGVPFSAVYRHNPDGSITGGMGTFKKTK